MSRLQSVEKPSCPLSGNWVSITYTTENRQVLRTPLLLQCVTEMCDGAGSDAEYAGMAVHRAHGGRGGPADRSREKVSALSAWWYLSCAVWMKTAIGISLPLNLWPKNPGAPMECCFRIWRTVVCPRPGLSFQMHTPDWFRQFVNPFPTPHGSAAKCISCGIF